MTREPSRADQIRYIVSKSISKLNPTLGILLSGGLDTSIIADHGTELLGLTTAITLTVPTPIGSKRPPPSDEEYAVKIAKANNLDHHILRIDDPMHLMRTDIDSPLGISFPIFSSFFFFLTRIRFSNKESPHIRYHGTSRWCRRHAMSPRSQKIRTQPSRNR